MSWRALVVNTTFPVSADDYRSCFVRDEVGLLRLNGVDCQVLKMPEHGFLHPDPRGKSRPKSVTCATIGFPRLKAFYTHIGDGRMFDRWHWRESFGIEMLSRSVVNLSRRSGCDIVHAHFAYPEGYAVSIACTSLAVPCVVTVHGADVLIDAGLGWGIRRYARYEELVRLALSRADRVIVGSRYLETTVRNLGVSQRKIASISYGVDLDRFRPGENQRFAREVLGIPDVQTVGALGYLIPRKGQAYLLRAFKIVVDELPSVQLIIGGAGPLRERLEELALSLGIQRNVRFLGPVLPSLKPRFYEACDVFAMPSLVEGFGIVTIEAMATGIPVVGFDVPATNEIVQNGSTGHLVLGGDSATFAGVLLKLLTDDDARLEMSRKARRVALEKYDINQRMGKILQLYSQLLS